MKRIYFILIIFFLKGCSDGVVNSIIRNDELKEIRFTGTFQNDSIHTDPANILSVKIQEHVLMLRISYTGGCEVHDFELYSLRTFKESYPVQLDMRLSHNANGDICDRMITDTLYFNLDSVRDLYYTSYRSRSGAVYLNIQNPAMEVFKPSPLYRF